MLRLEQDGAVLPDGISEQLLRLEAGKGADGENFPVASFLLPAATRSTVLAYYRFARMADDVADSPILAPEVKLAALDAADLALRMPDAAGQPLIETPLMQAATTLSRSMQAAGVPVDHARHLLQAFKRDAAGVQYRTWSDLLVYCTYSAAPVGRFLLDLHGEDRIAWAHADPLCNAHQILNHVQDCGEDYRRLARIYLPQRWLDEAGARPEMLSGMNTAPPLRRVLDRVLTGAEQLLAAARPLPDMIGNRGLRIQAQTTLAMGRRLLAELRRRDPLAERVALGTAAKAGCVLAATVQAWRSPRAR